MPILAGVLPRLANIGFSFSQPYLIQRVLEVAAEPNEPKRKEIGYSLVGAYALVYIGMSVSSIFSILTSFILTVS